MVFSNEISQGFSLQSDSGVFLSPSLSLCITKRQWGQGQKPDEAPGVISRNNEPICPPIIPEMTDLNIFPQLGESQSTVDHLLCKCVFHMQAS